MVLMPICSLVRADGRSEGSEVVEIISLKKVLDLEGRFMKIYNKDSKSLKGNPRLFRAKKKGCISLTSILKLNINCLYLR